jgi:hypothetical protein
MLTDAPPRKSDLAQFRESDRITTLDLPGNDSLLAIAKSIESAMKDELLATVRHACAEFLASASHFYQVSDCNVRVLAARPLRVREHWTTELFGDYDPGAKLIRVWMRNELSKLLGHSNVSMTERYAKLAAKHIVKTGSVSREIWSKLEPEKEARKEVKEVASGQISSPECVRIVSAT